MEVWAMAFQDLTRSLVLDTVCSPPLCSVPILLTQGFETRCQLTPTAYGSLLLTGVAADAPETFDQIILTGFTYNVTTGKYRFPYSRCLDGEQCGG